MLRLQEYQEVQPHRGRRIVWAVVNRFIFPFLPEEIRKTILRLFGAKIGKALVYRTVKIYAPWNLVIGDWTCIGHDVEIYNKAVVKIGNQCVVSQGAYICTAGHDVSSPLMKLTTGPIMIGDQCWVAARAILLSGVSLGEGAVVGAGAVVPKDVPPWSIVVGNPARVVGKRELRDEET